MGIAYKLSCHRCGYESDLLYLGQGMAMLPEQIVGTCTCCDNLTTISINESYGVCSLCGAKDRVIFRGLTLSGTKTHVKQRFLPLTPLLMVSDVLWSPVLPA